MLRRNRNYTTKEMSEKCGSARNRTWVFNIYFIYFSGIFCRYVLL